MLQPRDHHKFAYFYQNPGTTDLNHAIPDEEFIGTVRVVSEFIAFPGSENILAERVVITLYTGEVYSGWRHKSPDNSYLIGITDRLE